MVISDSANLLPLGRADAPPCGYERTPEYESLLGERDVGVPMRDGVRLAVDVYRPETDTPLPVLLAFAIYNKDLQGPDMLGGLPPQPAWSTLWAGLLEAGDTRFFVSRGYVHVVATPRGVGSSEGGGSREWDCYDLIAWIAEQPWCDGNVGMIGISGFGAEQLAAAKQRPPALKAIFPFDPRGAYGSLGGFRDEYPGGVVHLFRYLISHFSAMHQVKEKPGALPLAREALWREAINNPDYLMYPHIANVLAQKGQHLPAYFDILIDPFETDSTVADSESAIARVSVPTYTGSGWYGYTYKTHLSGAQNWFRLLSGPKKLMFAGPAHLERPFHSFHDEILRWNDHWLKGIDTGIMDEPRVKYWVMGANVWRSGADWPLPETQWAKLYLNSWGRLRPEPFSSASIEAQQQGDSFVQMPPTQTNEVARLRYLSEPLNEDLLIAGPISLTLHAAINQDDANWIVILKDIGPDVGVQSVRDGERTVRQDLPERELTRGWLKASNRALDEERSTPWKPWHKLTRAAKKPVIPGDIIEYRIEILATANLFRRGHRICLDITSIDFPTGVGGATNAEYVPYHIGSARTTLHTIYHDASRPSHLLLPVIPGTSV